MRGLTLVALAQLFIATGCLTVSNLDHEPTPTPQLEDREDCGEMLGSAFRSESERDWFTENCSGWAQVTLGRVATDTPTPAPTSTPSRRDDAEARRDDSEARQDDEANDRRSRTERRSETDDDDDDDNQARCARMRGQAYESRSAREWFLENCVQSEVIPGEPSRCAEIRGRPYESAAQRRWFLENCTSTSTIARDPDPDGPDRHNCDEIRGTQYRSGAERRWFLENCTRP